MKSALVAIAACVACAAEKPPSPPAPVAPAPRAAPTPTPTTVDDPDAPPSPAVQEARLAAIQKAMNDLAPAVQQCWAAAATERFDIAGELTAQIAIARPGVVPGATAQLVRDTARTPALSACVVQLLSAYRWAPPLAGQSIQLPFKLSAPDGQSTIDRALVAWGGQGTGAARIAVRVLLDEANTGNAAASMFEVAIAPGGTTGYRWAERAELWYFLTAGEVRSTVGGVHAVAAGDMMYVRASGAREVRATAGELRAMIAVVPGGREGTARSGALPNREVTGIKDTPAPPVVVPAGKPFHDPAVAAAILQLPAGGTIAPHVHAADTELLYVLEGSGTLTVNGVALPISPTSVVQIPRGAKHGLTGTAALRAVQILARP